MGTTIHPKTGGAAIGGALGVLLVAIANSIHGVHIPQGVTDGIAAFLPIAGAYLTPSPDTPAAAGHGPVTQPQGANLGGEPVVTVARAQTPDEPVAIGRAVPTHDQLTQLRTLADQLLAEEGKALEPDPPA